MTTAPLETTPMRAADSNTAPVFELPTGSCDAHFHVFEPGYPHVAETHYTFPDATLAQYVQLTEFLGIERMVLVQPSYYGTDNRLTLDVLREVGPLCRGVVQVDENVTDRELDGYHDLGVRAIRLDLFARADQPTIEIIEYVRRMALRTKPRGWHLQFYTPGTVVRDLLSFLADLEEPFVIDHMGYMKEADGLTPADGDRLIDVLRHGNCWIKLSGPYRIAKDKPLSSVRNLGQRLVAARADRLCWGSDWPHLPDGQRDTGELLNLLLDWAPDPLDRRRILVESADHLFFANVTMPVDAMSGLHERVASNGLHIGRSLYDFVTSELLVGLDLQPTEFWARTAGILAIFAPRNARLLDERGRLQAAIDEWHAANPTPAHGAHREFLERVGYIVPSEGPVQVDTADVDPEIASIAGPQLVVPVTNARYVLNAVNARWGSLYDALYGTDALGDLPPSGAYNSPRGDRVIAWSWQFLDEVVPLDGTSHADVVRYAVADGRLVADCGDAGSVGLSLQDWLDAYIGNSDAPSSVFLRHHGLGIEIVIDREHPVGSTDRAGVADIRLEAAVTTIMDCEDSVAAVDAVDKTNAYRNWLGLMKGDLSASIAKNGSTFERTMNRDRIVTKPDRSTATVRSRSLMMVRNVGHLMSTPAVLDADSNEVPEGVLDAIFTVACAMHDLRLTADQRNSPAGSVYVVKPKMHGPEEVALTDDLLASVEDMFGLPRHTVKLGIMDEERRTSVNLAECIRAAKSRVAFINTGFLDRTGDEIHTSMHAGPMVRKAEMKQQRWMTAYEVRNVDIGLAAGLAGRGQVGKGMWAAPDLMNAMLEQKGAQLSAGASCAWVPSPTAATLHATHYHYVDVHERQRELATTVGDRTGEATIDDLLTIPIAPRPLPWSVDDVQAELDNNIQGILGYVVRWVDQGVGCSKVPDINDVALMEDRATCRISSQHVANWLMHDVVTPDQVMDTMRRMAVTVDAQNADEPDYAPLAPGYDGSAFAAACDLVFHGATQPSGYTEPILHRHRLAHKSRVANRKAPG